MPFIVTLIKKPKNSTYRWDQFLPKLCWDKKDAFRVKRQAELCGAKVRVIERPTRPYA